MNVGIPESRIFTVNHKVHERCVYIVTESAGFAGFVATILSLTLGSYQV
jgi:phosphatidate phosphatase PAH1